MQWFWYFILYSFGGCGLEKLFAIAIGSEQRRRKCFLILPLCPVYGLAMCALLALAPDSGNFWVLVVLGGVVCTGVEYLVHLFCDKVFHVWFWDYRDLPGQLSGRVCPQFAAVWGFLSAWAVGRLHPAVEAFAAAMPGAVTFLMWEVFAVDCVCTAALLLRHHDRDLLSIGAVWALSHASTSR